MEKKYYITIITTVDGLVQQFVRWGETVEGCIHRELGGWDNLSGAMTSGTREVKGDFMTAGTTKDGVKAYSIICLVEKIQDEPREYVDPLF